MRTNLPVTQREYEFPDNATLMSTTDTQSHIDYANAAFVEVSGFERDEIQGQPHNLVRHPDMPTQAFADMWKTLKGGEPWTALVKNRRKNGDHYWVRANAVPVVRNGAVAGFMSVRTKASRSEIDGAEKVYKEFREGKAGNRAFHKGLVIRTGLMGWTALTQRMSVRWRIRLALAALAAVGAGLSAVFGLRGAALAESISGLVVTAALASWWLEVQIATPLERVLRQALDVASGRSQQGLELGRVDEIGMTLRSINQLGLMFRWLIDDVAQQVSNVQTAIDEIAQGNNDLSSRTEQSAASVEQTAASMTQMTASVKNNADTTREATRLAGSASHAASQGGEVMAGVTSTMGDITQSSRKIADIIGVIDSIAFQTNILALNAAVEAARAGEQGRGFAVVASEVRALAGRSAEAAKEIKQLIGASVEKVESGSKLVADAGESINNIVTQVRQVSQLIGDISEATQQQSEGVSQVGDAVAHLDQITQQNAALVEQSAAAATSLQQQAQRLVEAVNVFRQG
ncbi:hypothetical protein RD110_17815 [Rhodoferax koreense]|uniref:Aerotaxis receptor Aer n=1 Tax=Rhodoferax koreensis TaxID=1842727 RepID=A0A1P8JYK2_9BURK|nr:PAS domain-containing methyl-accepting chemotaxis protein [Rhodoferax koreense]APW38834.1 hypothetical protein RD110_17815 [Rhodoferax koreense]